ncbi:LacI family DNA-binding transcriptional regulator [Agromyces sp. NPDC056523]|uniref:LacI family DNA-binding transcriptional regulator n=1 Tax=Agromyces sp. NPDC056523 TaxID=3345850 RepID=UPI003670455E
MSAEISGRQATSFDVARAAGVSRSTVSQVLNGDGRFPAETRAKVIAAAEGLNYRPSRAGRALVTGLSDIVVVLVPNATFGPHLQDSIDRITNASATAGLSVVVRFGRPDEQATLISVLDLRPTAVVDLGVLSQPQRMQLEAAGIRSVPSASRRPHAGDDADPFDILIGRLQVRELVHRGPRTIVYAALADDRLDPFGPPRREGIRREAAKLGLREPLEIRVPLDLDGATSALVEVLNEANSAPVGLACYNDDVAIAVIAAVRRLGKSIPQDVAVVGVDRTDIGQLVSPRLTTIAIDMATLMDYFVTELRTIRHGSADEPDDGSQAHDPSALVHLIRGETT